MSKILAVNQKLKSPLALAPFLLWLIVSVTTNICAQVSDSPGSVNCRSAVDLNLTVTTESGAVISDALVILREDTSGHSRGMKAFRLELRTDANGKVGAAVPCNYLDILVAHDGFAPSAKKVLITKDAHTFSVSLKTYPITRTTELLAPEPD